MTKILSSGSGGFRRMEARRVVKQFTEPNLGDAVVAVRLGGKLWSVGLESLAWAGSTLIPKREGGVPLSLRTDHGYSHRVPLVGFHPNETLELAARILDPPKSTWSRSQTFDYDVLAKISLHLERALLDGDPGFWNCN